MPVPTACTPKAGLPKDAPALSTTTWTNISPQGFPFDPNTFSLGLAVSPCNPSYLYLVIQSYDTQYGGIFRSANGGATWAKLAHVAPNYTGVDHIDNPVRVRVDPNNPLHIYVADGVRGGTQGFWASTDGGDTFVMPDGFANLNKSGQGKGMFQFDAYDIALDPSDANHILLTNHSGWGDKWNDDAGVLESIDGGTSWIIHEPKPGWGHGHAINFLYRPDQHIGDRNTWMLGTEGAGMWRTTDAGQTWTQVSQNGINHGGGNVYYDKTGVAYAASSPFLLCSTDNGAHWTQTGPFGSYNAVLGDGKLIYARALNQGVFMTTPEGGDGQTWSSFSTQSFGAGAYELALDPVNGILYSSTWGAGVWALKVAPR